jgi:hypothetical protein
MELKPFFYFKKLILFFHLWYKHTQMTNIQVTKYLANRFNFEVNDGAKMNTILNIAANAAKKNEKPLITVAEVEAEDEAKLVKRWGFAIKETRDRKLQGVQTNGLKNAWRKPRPVVTRLWVYTK